MMKRKVRLLWLWHLFCASTLIAALVMPVLEPVHAASATPGTGLQSLYAQESQSVYAQEPPDPDGAQTPMLIGPQVRHPAWLLDLLGRPAPYTTMAGVVILQAADTGDNGLDAEHIYNGDRITYTIMLSNTSGVALNDINVVDILPRDALADIVIAGSTSWEFNYETITYLDQIGIEETITATREISWSIASLAHGQTHTLTFSGNVVGQEDNTTFINRAFVLYYPEGSPDPGSASAAELLITAHMRIPIANLGGMTISS
ncbi:MAG: DUF11 domain-containing protein, partial [Anaerolineae bacterium]|nr:DUF11 domain-containing protein [Anaerolineae bacterium]